ncbi:MAG: dTDP-4-dehydrorhamnose 3,5-epimerase [Pseudomonadota bacterium]
MAERFTITATAVAGVAVVERRTLGDDRGFLERLYCADELPGFPHPPVQINRTLTRRVGSVRGLHFQRPPRGEAKLVSCLRGRVFDVALDLRAGSTTFGHVVTAELSADNRRALLIPEGCAHGFQTLEPDSELLYLHSTFYAPDAEGGIHHASPALGIKWPLTPVGLSARDKALPAFSEATPALAVAVTP